MFYQSIDVLSETNMSDSISLSECTECAECTDSFCLSSYGIITARRRTLFGSKTILQIYRYEKQTDFVLKRSGK